MYPEFNPEKGNIPYFAHIQVTDYGNRVMKGSVYHPYYGEKTFKSTMEFLRILRQEIHGSGEGKKLDELHRPSVPADFKAVGFAFQLHVAFCQNVSWQGSILWPETHVRQNFRSVLELLMLIDEGLTG